MRRVLVIVIVVMHVLVQPAVWELVTAILLIVVVLVASPAPRPIEWDEWEEA